MSLKQVSLAISKVCNIGCTYCTVKDMSYKAINLDNLEEALKWVNDNSNSEVDVYLGFKEPLTDFPLIEKAVQLRKEKFPNVMPRVLSNGVLMNEEKTRFFYENRDHIKFTMSLDGKEESNYSRQTKNGRQVSEVINFDLLFNKYRGVVRSFSVTLSPVNAPNLYENIVWMTKELGVRGFVFSVWTDGKWSPEDIETTNNQLSKIHDYFVSTYGTEDYFIYGTASLVQYDISSGLFNKDKCGAGVSHVSIDGAGQIYSCATAMPGTLETYAEKFNYKNPKATWINNHLLGDVKSSTYESLPKRFYQDEFEKCNTCPIKNTCVKCRIQYEAYDAPFSEGSCDMLMMLDKWLKKASEFSTKYEFYKEKLGNHNINLIKHLSLSDRKIEENLNLSEIYSLLSLVEGYSSKLAKSSKYLKSGETFELVESGSKLTHGDLNEGIYSHIQNIANNLNDIKSFLDTVEEKCNSTI
jgi:radical SAM protein with 4Fe4S-binding SPASM domain